MESTSIPHAPLLKGWADIYIYILSGAGVRERAVTHNISAAAHNRKRFHRKGLHKMSMLFQDALRGWCRGELFIVKTDVYASGAPKSIEITV